MVGSTIKLAMGELPLTAEVKLTSVLTVMAEETKGAAAIAIATETKQAALDNIMADADAVADNTGLDRACVRTDVVVALTLIHRHNSCQLWPAGFFLRRDLVGVGGLFCGRLLFAETLRQRRLPVAGMEVE